MEKVLNRDFKKVRGYFSKINSLNPNSLPKSITILGAGISGLVAAYELKKLNYEVKILEASNRIGGRIWTYRFDDENITAYGELGAMRLPFNHEFTHYYINEMGLQSQLKKFVTIFKNNECFLDIKGKVCRLKDVINEIYPSYEFSKNRKFKSKYTERFASALKTIVDAMSPKEIRELFETDLHNYLLDELDYSLERCSIELNDEEFSPNNVLPLLSKLRGRCEDVLRTYMRHIILESSSDLYQLAGGMNQLPDAIANHLKDDIRLNAEVTGISLEDNKVKITINGNEQLYSDTVLCTIPFSVLREIKLDGFSKEKLDVIHNLTYVGATKVLFYCKDRFWEKDKYQIKEGASVSDRVIRQLYYPLASQDNSSFKQENPGVLLASYVIGEDSTYLAELSHHEQINLIKRSVSRFHPEIETEDMVQDVAVISWEKHKWTRGCSGVMWLGRSKYNVEAVTKPEKKLYFAGEHCSMDNAWIEGAITSALSQVEEIVQLQTRTILLEPSVV
ncbi:MAG: FAD-dependent oxidoreductase [Mojavia pulchra JT2-VF2]|jgi:monoamine oxidase|uniref:FAD-dependent oxidoreductase n=1 Tax=Mojavia pulchra JT2-VF2 TaxID=287848 RepID=A0A951Q0C0_9NOST|nr:FAD-dependent oxidoreductase [Mojavia pulchra JT2-VF2]